MTRLKYSRINLQSIFRRRSRKLDSSCSVVLYSPPQHLQHNLALSEIYANSRRLTMSQLKLFLIASAPSKTCALDPIPTRLLKQCTDLLAPTITSMINPSLSTGTVPNEWKDAIVLPTLKRKQDILTKEDYRPISNLPFVSKICEKTVAVQFQIT